MLVDLNIAGKQALVLGAGEVGERKALKLADEGAHVTWASRQFSESSRRLAAEKGISLVEVDLGPRDPSLGALLSSADLVVVATDDPLLNLPVVKQARERRILVSVVDGPSLSDFCFPAVTRKGGIHIAVYTGGKSPALARLLRKRVEQLITNEDVLQVELQQFARGVAKRRMPDSHSRRNKLYEIIGSEDVLRSLREGNLQEAKVIARKIIEET